MGFQLNGEGSIEAWEDFKGYLIDVGFLNDLGSVDQQQLAREKNRHSLAKMAFKHGFAIGGMVHRAPNPIQGSKAGYQIATRRGPRSVKEQQQDARLVSSIMQKQGRPMELHEITNAVNSNGGDWYAKSASGHMKKIMEVYPTIKKIGRGLYSYEQ